MSFSRNCSKKAISRNIATLMREYERDGHVAGSWPPNRAQAIQQAVAIAQEEAKAIRTRPPTRSLSQSRMPMHV